MSYPVSVYHVRHPDPFHIPTRAELEAFITAARHHWAIDAIMHGYPIPWPARLELEAHAYPGQPTHHSAPPVRPCRCIYHVMNTPESGYLVVPAPSPTTPYDVDPDPLELEYTYAVWYPRCPVLSWFTIARHCPHHGAQ
jgi:hypothetical protein